MNIYVYRCAHDRTSRTVKKRRRAQPRIFASVTRPSSPPVSYGMEYCTPCTVKCTMNVQCAMCTYVYLVPYTRKGTILLAANRTAPVQRSFYLRPNTFGRYKSRSQRLQTMHLNRQETCLFDGFPTHILSKFQVPHCSHLL